ncbi:MAG: Holliday junction branch migration protein RuvA [Clostridiales bacterium]|nr:Holliday junction branch migration protein RuvA [Clostridiales bacterium]
MYSYIIGIVTQKEQGKIALENNGIGYEINVSNQTLEMLEFDNEPVKIYTYLVVREDEMSLYGFITKEEKNMFLLLTTVSGIGPKMAMGILSETSIPTLMNAIATEDLRTLTKIKGLGKKTAERLLVELKDKVNPMEVLAMGEVNVETNEIDEQIMEDAISALTGLGLSKNEAYRTVKEVATKDMQLEDIITKALRSMSK